MKTLGKMVYETPKAEVVVIDLQGVLCVSGGSGETDGDMTLEDVDPFSPINP